LLSALIAFGNDERNPPMTVQAIARPSALAILIACALAFAAPSYAQDSGLPFWFPFPPPRPATFAVPHTAVRHAELRQQIAQHVCASLGCTDFVILGVGF
jgi:hypothetical protein